MSTPHYPPVIFGVVVLILLVISLYFHYDGTEKQIKIYRNERLEWINTNEERNRQVYSGDFNGIFSLVKISTHEAINGACSFECFEIICFHHYEVVNTFLVSERIPIHDGAVCPVKPSEYLARSYENGKLVIVVHNVDPAIVDTLRDHSF
jgi:hypothetical protein